jgi:iron complex outermembrane receptor protein
MQKSYRNIIRVALLCGVPVVLSVQAGAASAQDTGLAEIVVTATKREQDSQRIGVAVSSLTADQMSSLNVVNSIDVVKRITGMNLASPLGEGNNPSFYLRGVGLNDFGENNEAPVAVYVDEVYNATLGSLNFATYDLDRVEVLKGPQGTLYGRNSTGGLIHYITAKPSATAGGFINASYGRYNERKVEGAVTGPLSENLSARLSGIYYGQDAYVKNRAGRNTNEGNSLAGRLQLLYSAPSGGSVLLNAHAGRTDTVAPSYQHRSIQYDADGRIVDLPDGVVNPGCAAVVGAEGGPGNDCFGYRDRDNDPYANEIDRVGFLKVKTYGGSAKIKWPIGQITLTSITAYEHMNKSWGEDTDTGPLNAFAVSNYVKSRQFTQEIRIDGDSDRFKWMVGGYYFVRTLDGSSELDMRGLGLGYPKGTYHEQTKSLSVFGQAEYEVSDLITLIGGVRYTHDKKPYDYYVVDPTGLTVPPPVGVDPATFRLFEFNRTTAGNLALAKADLPSYRLEVDFHVAPKVMVYASASQGTKGPGFISGTLAFFGPEPFDNIQYLKETLRAYETGVKSRFLDNKIQLNVAAFYYDYKDVQSVSFVNTLARVVNKDARVYGVEVDLAARPMAGLDLTLGGSVLDTKFRNSDIELPAAPPFQINGSARYEWSVGKGSIAASVDGSYSARQYFDNMNNPAVREKGYGLLNANLTYKPTEALSVSVWGKNLTDTVYRTYAIPVADFGFQQDMMGRPRWFGGTIGYKF